jgi:hypothetical protein
VTQQPLFPDDDYADPATLALTVPYFAGDQAHARGQGCEVPEEWRSRAASWRLGWTVAAEIARLRENGGNDDDKRRTD